jgi:hypothetical protein
MSPHIGSSQDGRMSASDLFSIFFLKCKFVHSRSACPF